MRSLCSYAAAVAAAFIVCTPARSITFDSRKFISVAEVRPGMKAVGKSVFKGRKIESFNMEILAVLPKGYRGKDAVLARVLDGPVVERQSGIISGMSGSPVFIGGRLLGAISFGWSFIKEPIAGITPIEHMIAPHGGEAQKGAVREHQLATPIKVGGRTIKRVMIEPGLSGAQGPTPSDTIRLAPLGGLVLASGLSGRSREKLEELLKPFDLAVVPGMASQENVGSADDLQPGATMTIPLMAGDFQAYALGTLTWREGDEVIGFGHPFLGVGDVSLPLAGGVVHEIVPSIAASMKLGSCGRPVGTVTRDHLWAISGRAGKVADTLPVELSVGEQGRRSRSFRVQVARHRRLTAGLVASAALQAVDLAWDHIGEGTATVTLEIKAKGRPTIRRCEKTFSPFDAAAGAASQVIAPVAMFIENEFGSVDIEKITARIELQEARKTATLERVTARADKVKAGENLVLDMVLRPYRAEPVTRTVVLQIPADAPGGTARIVASGGSEAEAARRSLGIPEFTPHSLDDLVEWYRSRENADNVVVQVALPSMGVDVLGRVLPRLPRAMVDVMRAGRSSAVRTRPDLIAVSEATEWVVSGRQMLTVAIEGRPGIAPPKPISPPPGPPESPPQPPASSEGEQEEAQIFSAQQDAAARPAAPARPAPQEPARKEEEPKPVAKAPDAWVHSTQADFEDGEFDSVAVDSRGRLTLSRTSKTLAELPGLVPFSLLWVKDRLYVGTGNQGEVYSIDSDGKVERFFQTGQAVVHCLAADQKGNVYAGTSPDGIIYRISPDGKGEKFFESGQKYVWSLSFDENGYLYAGTGTPARVYRIDSNGRAEVLAEPCASHVFCVLPDGKGGAWAGTGQSGVVYHVAKGSAAPVLDASEEAILSLAKDEQGNIYAAASGKGVVYRIEPGGRAKAFFDTRQQHVLALVSTPEGVLAATGNGGLVFRIEDEDQGVLLLKPDSGLATCMAAGSDGAIFVGYSSPGLVKRLDSGYAREGTYESPVLDPGGRARWGRVSWAATVPEGTSVTVQTRSGETLDPDDRWSPWSGPCLQGDVIASPGGRYLQYRVTMQTANAARSPSLEQVRITYRAENRRPTLSLTEPKPGERLSKKVKVSWKAKDPDGDALVYDLSYSPAGQQNWETIKADLKETSHEWDLGKVKDGQYVLKVVASDRAAKPDEAASREETRLVWIDNTAPTVMLLRHATRAEDGAVSLRGVASDEMSSVRGVDWKIDSGEWKAASLGGEFDRRQATFTIAAENVSPGKHQVEVRAFDEAGNMGTDKASVEVPGPKKGEAREAKEREKPAQAQGQAAE